MIGPIHLRAALMENDIELVCGCFSRNYQTSLATGKAWFVPEERIYHDYKEMLEKEAALPKGERMDFVAIVTPNKVHYEQAALALDLGFDVVLDKPMTFSLEEALKLQEKVEKTGLTLALTHTYSGYPAVKEMKTRIAEGQLGKLRRIYVEYTQGWLSKRIELEGGNNAGWRTDPNLSGKGGCVGDIGTHACTSRNTSQARRFLSFVPNSTPLSRDGPSTTMQRLSCTTRTASKACCMPRKLQPARRTGLSFASMARRAASSGTRWNPTL